MSMIIKKLELQGFKSFAERTKIVFHPGITAIVGPNGTGKSNLVDAMLWSLGGHRQKVVRGDRTDEVIFSGNAKRPALSLADAVLTLSGDDEEMIISHRAFRSGENEYRMNGKTVRLKDIQDELWKHAIGEKEYFVIEQDTAGQGGRDAMYFNGTDAAVVPAVRGSRKRRLRFVRGRPTASPDARFRRRRSS